MDGFVGGIVLFNPKIERLKENVIAIYNQIDRLYVYNNGSDNTEDIKLVLRDFSNIQFIQNNENVGLATALNVLAMHAEADGYDWIVTLDQDSVAPANLIKEYKNYSSDQDIGMLCCKIIDRNFGERINDRWQNKGAELVGLCIASASAIRLKAWKKVGGFCNEMFIDSVDFDICMSLREYGYKILKINDVKLLHEMGCHSRKVKLFGKEELIFNHNPLRCYYIVRNHFLLGKRHHQLLHQVGLVMKRILLINIYEQNKFEKNKMMFLGIYHALKGRYGKF
ncbi:glycosyltransferase family 2 protein [Phocaeicola sp.]